MDKFIVKNGRKLKYGYTTGSCAAAAARAAVRMLFSGEPARTVTIDTPMGWELKLDVHEIIIEENFARCCIIKDAGDDPDATDGMKIFAEARRSEEDSVTVTGGPGVGKVTRKGLPAPVGGPAINPVPMKMIISETEKEKPAGHGVTVEISAPEGIEIAKKTFNPRLGIEGGISILGTTGIVEPMSNDAVMESLALEISMLKETGMDSAVFVPGKYGRDFISEEFKIEDGVIITMSNYIGYMLEQAVFYGMKKILLSGTIGKLIKVAGGIFDTHSRVTDARVEILAAHYAYLGGSTENVKKIMNSLTTEEALDYIEIKELYPRLAKLISERCMTKVHGEIQIEVMLFSQEKGLLARTEGAGDLALEIKKNSLTRKSKGD